MSQGQPTLGGAVQDTQVLPDLSRTLWLGSGCPTVGARFLYLYNHEHHHSGLGLLTPADVHYGRAEAILAQSARRSFAKVIAIQSAS
jgi:hypothetical protein